MFASETYAARRAQLKNLVKSGVVILPGNNLLPMNYASNTFPFRQDSTFLYYFGLDKPDLFGVIDVDGDADYIFGDDRTIEDVVWMGPESTLAESAEQVGVENVLPMTELQKRLHNFKLLGRKFHFLPQYNNGTIHQLAELTEASFSDVTSGASEELIKAVVEQRLIKSDEEIAQMEMALAISSEMYTTALKKIKPGKTEREIYGELEGISLKRGEGISFPMILSVHGEILHNHHHDNVMEKGQLLIIDSGAESPLHYASDITRTFPVSGKFTPQQKAVYQIVLDAQLKSIKMMKPGVMFKDCHLAAAEVIAGGLKKLGLMKGNIKEAVKKGAHALFFPHGLGHHIGLDVHDMEGLGEDYVGYGGKTKRSTQFGLAYLRMAKALEPGHVITVEPGIYFIPQLIANWRQEGKHKNYINYEKVEEYVGFGGIRIEDDVLVTEKGHRVLGTPIPKTVREIEKNAK